MRDFELRQGRKESGLIASMLAALFYIVLPFFVCTLIAVFFGEPQDQGTLEFTDSLLQLRFTALLFGLPIVLLSFPQGFYLRGTRSRLLFGIAVAALIVLYGYMLLLNGTLEGGLQAIGIDLDLALMFMLVVMASILKCLRYLSEYDAHRNEWLKSVGTEVPLKPRPTTTGMKEFSLRHGDFVQGTVSAKRAVYKLVVIPVLILVILPAFINLIDLGTAGWIALTDAMQVMAWSIVALAFPLLALAWFMGSYPRGTVSRLAFGLSYAAILALYLYLLLLQSGLQGALYGLEVRVDMGQIFLILMFLVIFVALRQIGDLIDSRKAWKKRLGIPVAERTISPERPGADFDPHSGKFEGGFKEAQTALLEFIVVPVIIAIIFVAVLASFSNPTTDSFADLVERLGNVFVLYGIPIVAFAFGKGFYPRGCLGRLAFALLMIACVTVLAFALLLGGDLEQAIRDAGLPLDLDALWALLLALILFHGLTQAAELLDHRRGWKIGIGRKVKERVEEERHSPFLDFRIRYGRCVSGMREATKALKRYMIWPSVIVLILIAVLEMVIAQLGVNQLSVLLDALRSITGVLLLFLVPIVVLTFLRGFYPKGSFSRLTFAWTMCIALAYWIWSITLQGKVGTEISMQQMLLGVDLDLSGIILIFVALELLWGLYYSVEFLSYRRSWIENRYQPVDEGIKRAKKERRKAQRGLTGSED